jgi:dCMP deaminase
MLAAAEVFARRSTCSRLPVGAVLARDGRVLSTGYNGAAAGVAHCQHGPDDPPCVAAVHAEANALLFAARHGVAAAGSTLYVTHAPCGGCAGLIINAGVVAVRYAQTFRTLDGVGRLVVAGVDVARIAYPGGPVRAETVR